MTFKAFYLKALLGLVVVMLASNTGLVSPTQAASTKLVPYEIVGTGSKFFDLEIEKFNLGASGPHVIAQTATALFVAERDSTVIRAFKYSKSELTETMSIQLPQLKDELAGAGKYILDIEVRGESDLFVSYLEYYDNLTKCDRVVVIQLMVSGDKIVPTSTKKIFASSPCWTMMRRDSVRGGYTASGRMAIRGDELYIEGGMVMIELGHNQYPNPGIGGLSGNFKKDVSRTNLFGSVTAVNLKSLRVTKLSTGHRNPQGLTWDKSRNILWSTEHGPSGGCELNIIKKGKNYGWPYVSLGREYFDEDLLPENNLFKTQYGTHYGYEYPAFAWNPSIGPSQLVVVPNGHPFGPVWESDLLVSTLKDQSIIRIAADKNGRVYETERISIGHRIRDLTIANDDIWASTDDGKLLRLTRFVPASN
jgi:hypothetical protein